MIEVVRRDDSYLRIPVTADSETVDLSAAQQIWFVLKAGNRDELAALVTKTKTGGDITVIDDDDDNIVQVHLEAADLAAALSPFSIWWGELQVKEADGRISTPWQGKVKILPDSQVATS